MASLATVFRKDKINKKGRAPIYFRIIKHRKVKYISSGIMLETKYWDTKYNRIKSHYPNSKRMNLFLTTRFKELEEKFFEVETYNKNFTSSQLRDHVMGKKPVDFWEFSKEAQKIYWTEGKIGTHDKNRTILNKLKTYMKGESLSFQDITVSFLMKYENHLRGKLGNHTNTVHNNLKFIKKLFNDAVRLELIDASCNPFTKYKLKTAKTTRHFLTAIELNNLENCPLEKFSALDMTRDMFVFPTYAGGMRVSDVIKLLQSEINATHVNFTD